MPLTNNYTPNDEQLVEAIKSGETRAYEILYKKYFADLTRFALYRTHSMDTSKEIVQEVFSKIWINKHLLDPRKSIKSYLFKCISNLIINRQKLHSSQTISIEDKHASSRVFNDEADREFSIDIRNAIDKLPEKIRTVYLLSRVDGFMYDEIAEICMISQKAVEKRMSKALTLLRKIFTKKYF